MGFDPTKAPPAPPLRIYKEGWFGLVSEETEESKARTEQYKKDLAEYYPTVNVGFGHIQDQIALLTEIAAGIANTPEGTQDIKTLGSLSQMYITTRRNYLNLKAACQRLIFQYNKAIDKETLTIHDECMVFISEESLIKITKYIVDVGKAIE